MTPERWRQVSEVCHAALARDASARAAYLDRACAGDRRLREDVDARLARERSADGFLAAPAVERAAEILAKDEGPALMGRPVGLSAFSAMTIAPGTRLGPFDVGALLGAGGMGAVYKARDTRLGRFVAIKVLPPERVADPDRERRFVQEANAASALNHPHIVTIYDISSTGDTPFIAMEYVDGLTLADAIGRRRVVFASLSENNDIWSVPVAADQADQVRLAGNRQRLTDNAAQDYVWGLSADGRKLAFASNRTGLMQVWLKDLETGKETALTSSATEKYGPVLSPDGSQLTYAESRTWSVYLVQFAGGGEQLIREAVPGLATFFTRDGGILYHDIPGRVYALDLASRRRTLLLEKPDHRLVDPQLSPDGRWLAFGEISRGGSRILVAPYRGPARIEEEEWIEVTEGLFWDPRGQWSPGSNVIYFSSDRDGSRCLWAQRLDPATKCPVGGPEALLHEHTPSRSISQSVSLVRDRLVYTMVERTGSIWMADWKAP